MGMVRKMGLAAVAALTTLGTTICTGQTKLSTVSIMPKALPRIGTISPQTLQRPVPMGKSNDSIPSRIAAISRVSGFSLCRNESVLTSLADGSGTP